MAEIQADSGNRLLPHAAHAGVETSTTCVAEAKRVAALGARGVNMTSDPQDLGAPDLANRAWDPFWEIVQPSSQLPVHFHIGASVTAMTFYGQYPWESHPMDTKLAIGGTLLFIGNARVVTNVILSGMFDRHPDLKMVSVESGVGWIPFILEALDYEMSENAPDELAKLKKMPSEYFRSNLYATFWFENNRNKLPELIDAVGEDSILFETDFPHPTCLYPNPLADGRGEDGHPRARSAQARSSARTPASSTGSEAASMSWTTIGHWVGGRAVAGTSGRTAPVFDPARGVQTAEVALASAAEVGRRRQGRGRRIGRSGARRR